tara:strand:- start:1442 stop:1966 length:525 start_codon:yes stop_codon:yes gene_type:complete
LAQEFTIKSTAIEDKINQLLPSQGGFQPGVDFSASTMVIPVVDLTETAEGSSLRQDLQVSLSHDSATVFDVNNTTSTILTTTGYFRIIGSMTIVTGGSTQEGSIILTDGVTPKIVYSSESVAIGGSSLAMGVQAFDFNVLLKAGDSLQVSADANVNVKGSARQIADLSGNLVNP